MNDNDTQLSKWKKFRKTIVWEYAQVIVVALILVFGFIRPFVVEAFKIPSGSMKETLLVGDRILVCKFIYGITIPGTDIKVLDFHKPARGDVFVFIPPHEIKREKQEKEKREREKQKRNFIQNLIAGFIERSAIQKRNFIKRIVAVEGDTIETRDNRLYVNGEAVDEDHYAQPMISSRSFPPFRETHHLPDTEYFSDYTLTSSQFRRKFPEGKPFTVPKGKVFAMGDNRDHSSDSRSWGPVDINDIKGQAFMIYWSFEVPEKNRDSSVKASPRIKVWEVWKLVAKIRFSRIGKLIHAQP